MIRSQAQIYFWFLVLDSDRLLSSSGWSLANILLIGNFKIGRGFFLVKVGVALGEHKAACR